MCCWYYERLSKLCMMLSFMKENNFANPGLCIISVGEFNHFGHPSAHVITELQKKRWNCIYGNGCGFFNGYSNCFVAYARLTCRRDLKSQQQRRDTFAFHL